MAVVLAHRPPLRRAGRALLLAVAGFGVATIGFGLSTNFALSFVLLALTGALDNVSVVVRGTLMQTLTPDEMRGRVAAVNTIFISSSNELGAFESGTVAALFGAVFSVVSGGIGTLAVVAAVTEGVAGPDPATRGSGFGHDRRGRSVRLAARRRQPLPAAVARLAPPRRRVVASVRAARHRRSPDSARGRALWR